MDYEDDILVETEILEDEALEEIDDEPSQEKPLKGFPKYSNEKLERVYQKYDFSKTYNPNTQKNQTSQFEKFVKENDESLALEESISVETSKSQEKNLNSKKFSVFKVCGIFVCALLIILSMINLATITDLEKKVDTTQKEINQMEVNVGKLIQDVGKLTDEEELIDQATQNGMEQINQEVKITLNDKNTVVQYESKTNFFDKICEFISNIFGG